jgi:hypothetical protein
MLKGLIAATMLTLATPAMAAEIVNTGPGPSTTTGYTVGSTQTLGGKFTVGTDTTITSIEGWLAQYIGDPELRISIYSDGGQVWGSELFSNTFTLTGATTPGWYGLTGLSWNVAAGSYWVLFGAVSGEAVLPGPATSPLGDYAVRTSSGTFADDTIDFGVRINGSSVVAGVPEPGTWALMLVGFGALGWQMRRRPRGVLAVA